MRLDGVVLARTAGPVGFVATRVAAAAAGAAGTVRIELQTGTSRIESHWPLTATKEFVCWLREAA